MNSPNHGNDFVPKLHMFGDTRCSLPVSFMRRLAAVEMAVRSHCVNCPKHHRGVVASGELPTATLYRVCPFLPGTLLPMRSRTVEAFSRRVLRDKGWRRSRRG